MSPALQREAFVRARMGKADLVDVGEALAELKATDVPDGVEPKGWVVDDDIPRWVPIGPSTTRLGQASGRPRVTGRVRDLAVSPDGLRAYAASAMGGVWYTGDGGHSWIPVGGWAPSPPIAGGNVSPRAVGCLLVDFHATDPAQDFVLVGTGEPPAVLSQVGEGDYGGTGILVARGPATRGIEADPWEPRPQAQITPFEGAGIYRLARMPGRAPGSRTAGAEDVVLAATTRGLFRGIRTTVGAPGYTWTRVANPDALPGLPAGFQPQISDVLWHPGGRIAIAVRGFGVAWSPGDGVPFGWLNGCAPHPAPGTGVRGRLSLASAPGTNRVYVLARLPRTAGAPVTATDTPTLFRIADITAATPAAVNVPGVPILLWEGQGNYDQTVAVEVLAGGQDRVFLGGCTHEAPANNFMGGVWCFDVTTAPALGLTPAAGISRVGAPTPGGGGDGADAPGLVGNTIHPDIHMIRVVGTPGSGQVWVGCDGGVFVSRQAGRVHTFASCANGLAALQPTFFSMHPTSSHFVASGFQDNGTQVRSGDSVWELVSLGDGGGTVFHPTRSQHIVSQGFQHGWGKIPDSNFEMPTRSNANGDAENGACLFYSGAAAVAHTATASRIAVGTHRVWLTENVGGGGFNSWRVLPFQAAPGAVAQDARNAAGVNVRPLFGIPSLVAPGGVDDRTPGGGPLGAVVTMRWVDNRTLLVLYAQGVVRYVEAAGRWSATVLLQPATQPALAAAPTPTTMLTDIIPAPGGQDFYLTTTGDPSDPTLDTCWFFSAAAGTMTGQGLRNALPAPAGGTSPLEPAYSLALDVAPATPMVYAGTISGLWRRAHGAPAGTAWERFDNGLPQAAVQDLGIWTDPTGTAGSPRLLRAAVQSRGLWEVDLGQAGSEPARTYLRVHARDDRRRFPTPMANPRRAPSATEENTFASPDIVVRPRAGAGIVPRWVLGATRLHQGNVNASNLYQLWTFQTAFRWLFPSVVANGQWTDTFGDLVELQRVTLGLPAAPALGRRFLDQALWDAVVQTTRVDPGTGRSSATPAHPLGVYRPSWHTPSRTLAGELRQRVPATEVELLETVLPRSVIGDVWRVHAEVSTVDILLHHRDMRAVPENGAFAILLRRSGPNREALLNSDGSDLVAFARDLATGNPHATPAGWTLENGNVGASVHRLPVALDARMPRAVSVDVDLAGVHPHHFVLFLALAGSTVDLCAAAPHAMPATPSVRQVARRWPHAALRMVQVAPRP